MSRNSLKNELNILFVLCILSTFALLTLQYVCDFDANDCNYSTQLAVDADPTITRTDVAEIDGRIFTDHSSLTEPTSDGERCIVPFTIGDDKTAHHFCTKPKDKTDLVCKTSKSDSAICDTNGHFLLFTNSEENATKFTMTFPSQKLTTVQEYEFSIRYFSECIPKDATTVCKELNDNILVKLLSGTGRVLGVNVFHLADGSNPSRWQIGAIRFNTTDNNHVTIQIDHEIVKKKNLKLVYGIDDVKILKVEPDPITDSTTTSTTTTTTTTSATPASSSITSTSSKPTVSGSSSSSTTSTKPPSTTSAASGLKSFSFLGIALLSLSAAGALF